MMEKISLPELEQKLLASSYVILDFTSPGCAPCKKIAQALPTLLAELQPVAIAAYEVDITRDPAIASRFFVLGVPTLVLLRQGQEIARFNSLPKTDTIRRLLS
jgi:thioredoxin 1